MVLEPRLEELLHAVASNAPSTLLRVPRSTSVRAVLASNSSPVSLVGLDVAEKELAVTYTNELATLLQDIAVSKLFVEGASRRFVAPYLRSEEPSRVLDPRRLHSSIRESRAAARANAPAFQDIESLLDACAQDPSGSAPTSGQLAAAAYRLRPDDRSRIIAAIDLLGRDQLRASAAIAGRVLAELPDERMELRARECLGACSGREGAFADALAAYAIACSDSAESVHAWMNRFFFALLCCRREDVEISAAWLNAAVPEESDLVTWFVGHIRSSRERGGWTASQDARRLSALIDDGKGAAAGRIARVLA